MQSLRVLKVFILIGILAGMVFGFTQTSRSLAAGDGSEKIEAQLMQRLLAEGQVDFFVRFSEQADLSAAYDMQWSERGWYVYNTLNEVAQRSQARAQAYLNAQGLAYRSFFSGNELVVFTGNLEHATSLARLSEVAELFIPPTYSITPDESTNPGMTSTWAGELLANHTESTVLLPETISWGVDNANGNEFWTTFDVRGEGILVANIDTGVRYTHEALFSKYVCGTGPHTNCWYDPDEILTVPTDGNGHGTHTMGTMVGDDPDGDYQIGMAPNARWIACQGCDTKDCESIDLAACADWILAPGGNPDNRPQVVNNSWGDTDDDEGDTWFLDKINNWRESGIFPAFSAGNNGPDCGSLGDPGSFQVSFASAAHERTYELEYTIGSRGPSAYGHEPYTKPNLSAPGVDVKSSYNTTDTTYVNMSGTSMATPHSAGAVALLWSCNPGLIGQIDATFELLQDTARTPRLSVCGGPPDEEGNYSFGYGYLDVFEAGFYTCGGVASGILQGHVYDTLGNPLTQATVTASAGTENNFQTLTDQYGAYSIRVPVGSYSVTAFLNGYLADTVSDTAVLVSETTTLDFHLTFLGLWTAQTWSPCTNLTHFDAEYYPGTGLVYILGGRYVSDASGTTVDTTDGRIFSFDPSTGECLAVPDAQMPVPVSNYTISLINVGGEDVLCTFGGRTATGAQTLAVQCYDPFTKQVTQINSLPAEYTYVTPGAQVVINNNVYLFGGIEFDAATEVNNLAHTYRYDTQNNLFTRLGDLSQARGYIQATVVDGQIFAFGGDVYDGATTLTAQTTAEVMADPEGAGIWNNAAVADLPVAAGQGRAFGFDRDSGYQLAGKAAIVALAQFPGASYEVIIYDVLSNTYYMNYPNLNIPRRNHAAVFVPLNTATPGDGLPGMWVMGGFCTGGDCGGDKQPYGAPEFFPVYQVKHFYIPIIYK